MGLRKETSGPDYKEGGLESTSVAKQEQADLCHTVMLLTDFLHVNAAQYK